MTKDTSSVTMTTDLAPESSASVTKEVENKREVTCNTEKEVAIVLDKEL